MQNGKTVTLTTHSDAATGAYQFSNLTPGVYTITLLTAPPGFLPIPDTQGTPGNGVVQVNRFLNITLNAGVNGMNNDFGFQGQAVDATQLELIGIHQQQSQIVLHFNGPLDPAAAQNPANYSLIGLGKDEVYGTRDDVHYSITAARLQPLERDRDVDAERTTSTSITTISCNSTSPASTPAPERVADAGVRPPGGPQLQHPRGHQTQPPADGQRRSSTTRRSSRARWPGSGSQSPSAPRSRTVAHLRAGRRDPDAGRHVRFPRPRPCPRLVSSRLFESKSVPGPGLVRVDDLLGADAGPAPLSRPTGAGRRALFCLGVEDANRARRGPTGRASDSGPP